VDVETSSSAKEARIAVRDRGPGVPVQHRPRVFDLFYQVDANSKRAGNAGVGLAIVRAVCELHGGSVTIHDRNGGGSEFQVRLPLAHRS
jgi:two-component system sensor histidine kinase ChvG